MTLLFAAMICKKKKVSFNMVILIGQDEVTSPGGTTIRGIQVIDRAGVRGTLMDAVQASCQRAKELGK